MSEGGQMFTVLHEYVHWADYKGFQKGDNREDGFTDSSMPLKSQLAVLPDMVNSMIEN